MRTRPTIIIFAVVLIPAALLVQAQQPAAPAAPAPSGRGGQPAQGARAGGAANAGEVRGPNGEVLGYSNTAFNENSRWRIHDADRPQPRVVMPPPAVGAP